MEQEEKFRYAGNLAEELQEIDKMLSDEAGVVLEDTMTRGCRVFLTIYCC